MYNNTQVNQNNQSSELSSNYIKNDKSGNTGNNGSLVRSIRKFLDTKTETVLTFAAAVAIATAFKDLILSIITNIIHPLFIKLILLTKINKYADITSLNASQDIMANFSQFIINIFSFILILVITYYLFQVIINTSSSS
jgi:large-conductance mechanosensitive channel